MKFGLALIIILALGMTACAKTITYTCSDGTVAEALEDCPQVPTEPEPNPTVPIEPEPEPELPAQPEPLPEELAAVFAKTSAVKSIMYDYVSPEISPASEAWWVMGEKAKVKVVTYQSYYVTNEFDTVYLNKATKVAAGYCEDRNKVNCPTPNKQFPAKFAEYDEKTPLEWIAAVPSTAVKKAGPQYDKRTTVRIDWIEYTDSEPAQQTQWSMLVWDFYGLPLKIDRTSPSGKMDTWLFKNMAVNLVKSTDLEHQTMPVS